MEDLYFCIAIFVTLAIATKHFLDKIRNRNLPPSPFPAIPILGHFHLFREPIHRSLLEISRRHGPILLLRLGFRQILLVSSPAGAAECLQKNDITFSNRPRFVAGELFGYNYTALSWAPYGDHWRNLRRISNTEILSANRLQQLASTRAEEAKSLIQRIYRLAPAGDDSGYRTVELKPAFVEVTTNVMTRMIAGKRYYGEGADSEEGVRYKNLMKEISAAGGLTTIGDFFPLLRKIGIRGGEKGFKALFDKTDAFMQDLVDDYRRRSTDRKEDEISEEKRTMIEVLLSLQNSDPGFYTEEIIKGLVLVMLLGGTDTTSATMEWALSLLLNHPQILTKARAEIDRHVCHDRLVNESDLGRLPYLHSIVLESLRIRPVGPIVARDASQECTIGGYRIPRDTILMVNMWALNHDPEVWEDPEEFKPKRFEGVDGNRAGFKLMPFGSGRRACPGDGLAMRMVELVLGTLIQCFEWERVGDELVDLKENAGLTSHKTVPLVANKSQNLPPSPFPTIPIIGHFHLFWEPIHRSLFQISRRHGPILFLRLGFRQVLLVSSPAAIEECLQKHDIVFANRPPFFAGELFGYNFTTFMWAPYGDMWRNLRRISSTEILSPHRLQLHASIRAEEVRSLIQRIYHHTPPDEGSGYRTVDMKSAFMEVTTNVMTRMLAGRRYYGEVKESEEGRRFMALMRDITDAGGITSIGDFFPVLRRIGIRGCENKFKVLFDRTDAFLHDLVEDWRRSVETEHDFGYGDAISNKNMTMIEVLLSLQKSDPGFYTEEIIKGLVLVSTYILHPGF
ncbi:hypothetical protein V2J09_023852 [Rumex salicifolius]